MAEYDYIIAGAGAAGLSLAYHLNSAGLHDKRILLLDRAPKTANDRTWCFWEAGQSPFEPVVFRQWEQVWFHGEGISKALELAPYRYKMIRGIDFYQFIGHWLAQQPNISVQYGEIERLEETPEGATVWQNGQPHRAKWVFSSLYQPQPKQPQFYYLLQHFKGWVIRTPQPAFDPQAATFMDFRVEQKGEVRFAYVLPFDEQTALVEYTLFSSQLLPEAEYDAGLREYLSQFCGVREFEVLETEFGFIPMTDAPFGLQQSPHILNIGIAGGRAKASTGYAFKRIQAQSRRIVESLLHSGQPVYKQPAFDRHAWLDSIYLNVLDKKREGGREFFSGLFKKNPATTVLRFLDEETSWLEDLRIMSSVNIPKFVAATLEVGRSRLFTPAKTLKPDQFAS